MNDAIETTRVKKPFSPLLILVQTLLVVGAVVLIGGLLTLFLGCAPKQEPGTVNKLFRGKMVREPEKEMETIKIKGGLR